jgi:hypothetical protein
MQRLFLKKNAQVGPAAPSRFQIWHRGVDGSEREMRLTGFSYYGEISGLRPRPTDKFVELIPDGAAINEDWRAALRNDASTRVLMTYGQWLAFLAEHNVNHSRIFVFPEVAVKAVPFARYPAGHPKAGKFDLNTQSAPFFGRLRRYLGLARRKGIVVQISFASIQSLRDRPRLANDADWNAHPFNAKNNGQGFIVTPDDPNNPDDQKPGGIPHFCRIQEPSGAADTVPEKLYLAQKQMVDWIVDAAKPYWNVMFEIFNEPNHNLAGAENWHFQVARWLDAKLREPGASERSHLVTLNAPEDLLRHDRPKGSLLRALLLQNGQRRAVPLVDVYQFHGSQWGGPSGFAACDRRPNPRPTQEEVANITRLARAAVNGFYARFLDTAGTIPIEGSRVAVICDGDAHYTAQDNPGVYARVASGLGLSYIHRWNECHLSQGKLKAQAAALSQAVPREHAPRADPTPPPPVEEVLEEEFA